MDKFMGDGGMALFGIPPWHSAERRNQPLRAFNVCENLLSNFNSMKNAWIEKGYPVDRVGIGFGIATGKVSFGTIGKGKRIDLTVIGSAANLSARLCAMAKHGEIKMDLVTYTAVKECLGPCERTVHTNIKGFESVPVEVFTWSKPQ
jgi:class 3 adenylate cyclase